MPARAWEYVATSNKCIGDDTKSASRHSLNCIKNKKNMAKNDVQYGGCNSYTLQCDTWLWHDMPLHSPKRPPYWNSTSGFDDFDHITAVDMSFCTSLRNFIQIGPPSAEKNDVMSIFKMVDLRPLGFQGSHNGFFKRPCTTSYRSSINTIALNCLVFEKIAFFYLDNRQTNKQTNRQTNKQMDITNALSRSRCRERRLNKHMREFDFSLAERVQKVTIFTTIFTTFL